MTICNLNRISCGQLKKTYEEWDVEKDIDTFNNLSEIVKLSRCPNINEPETATILDVTTRRKRSIEALQEGLGDTPDFLTTEYEFLEYYMSLNESIRLMIGHQFSDFIMACTFSGSDCLNIRFPLKL